METQPNKIGSNGAGSGGGGVPLGSLGAGGALTLPGDEKVDLFREGYDRARKSGATDEDERDVETLTERARTLARTTFGRRWNPKGSAHHRMLEQEHGRLAAELDEEDCARRYAQADQRDREGEWARVRVDDAPPERPDGLMWLAAIVIGISAAFCAHDLLVGTVGDEVLAWVFAAIGGVGIGWFIAWAMVGSVDPTGHAGLWRWAGLVGGVTIGVALLVLRLVPAETPAERALACAFALVELGVVVMLEAKARELRDRWRDYSQRKAVERPAAARADAARAELERRQRRIAELRSRKEEIERFVREHDLGGMSSQELEDQAVRAATDGYRQGIGENLGRTRGL